VTEGPRASGNPSVGAECTFLTRRIGKLSGLDAATAWTALAARIAEDLERLAEYALSEREALHLREASAAFEEYRRILAEEQALLGRGDRAHAVRLTDAASRVVRRQGQPLHRPPPALVSAGG
jgi:hypothetical protein